MENYRTPQNISMSSSDGDSDNDDVPWKRRKRSSPEKITPLPSSQVFQKPSTPQKKKNNVWGAVLTEQKISEDIKDFSLIQTAEKTRTVESYENSAKKSSQDQTIGHPSRKRKRNNRKRFLFHYSKEETDKKIAERIAERLKEPKAELIERTLVEVGRKLGIELLRKTEEIESAGGMMVNDGTRRRTRGGVYFQLLRTHDDVSKSQVDNIFKEERKVTETNKKNKRRIKRRLKARREAKNKDISMHDTNLEIPLPPIIDVVVKKREDCTMEMDKD